MIVNCSEVIPDSYMKSIRVFDINGSIYYLQGVFIWGSCLEGEESVREFDKMFAQNTAEAFLKMKGAFSCIIVHADGALYGFTDNSHMHCLYLSKHEIATGFLEIIKYRKTQSEKLSINYDCVCQLLTLGRILFWDTLFNEIKRSKADEYYIIRNGEVSAVEKGVPGIDAPSNLNAEREYLHELTDSLRNVKFVQALTGGYDSRLLFACMREIKKSPVFISGDNFKDSDIKIAKIVAGAVDEPLDIIIPEKPELNKNLLDEAFVYSDGMNPFLNAGCFRIMNFLRKFSAEGKTLVITGDGGVLHKDWEWAQDLPFYNKKSTNLGKFYDQRIEFIHDNKNLSKKLIKIYSTQKERIVSRMKDFVKETNTKSYDYLYYYINGKRDCGYTRAGDWPASYAPLFERDLVRYAYNQPRFYRFFYNLIRYETTAASKKIARIPTVYGTTASNETLYVLRDVWYQGIDYYRKLMRLLGRILFNKSVYCGNVLTWSIDEEIMNIEGMDDVLNCAKRHEVISENTVVSDLSANQISALYLFYRVMVIAEN